MRGKVFTIFNDQLRNSKKRNHCPPKYSRDELLFWCESSTKFKLLYKKWKDSNFKKDLAPSIDRIKDHIPYSFDNIQVMTWKENNSKSHKNKKNGINCNQKQRVRKICKKTGIQIKVYRSISEASRLTNISRAGISACCRGVYKTSGGFIWKY